MNTKTMRLVVWLAGCVGVLLATVITGLAIVTRDWSHAALGGVWLFLVSANFKEYLDNQNRRNGYHDKEMATMKREQIVWTEQIVMAKSMLASRFAHKVQSLGLANDPASVKAAGVLFAGIANMELPDGVQSHIVELVAKAGEAAGVCMQGTMPSDRVLH